MNPRAPAARMEAGFTLLEVMIAVAFIGIAMLALLSLHQRNLEAVMHAQELTRASMLAQALMSEAESERFPEAGTTRGDFERFFPHEFPDFRWQREVAELSQFPDIRRVLVRVTYGRGGRRHFELVEFMHNPNPVLPNQPGGEAGESEDQAPTPLN